VKQSLPIKIDLHIHTHYSRDASTTLRDVILYAKKHGIDGVAVTDHDTVLGAVRLAKQKRLVVVPGEEIETLGGHVLALNIGQLIEHKLSISETIEKIHDLGGIAVVAHPAAVLKTGLGHSMSMISNLDAVEVMNSSSFPFFLSTYLSRRLAHRLGLPQTAGSDAHHAQEIGTAYTLVQADSNLDEIVEAIRKGRTVPFGKPISWARRLERGAYGAERRLAGY
jgi:predicted metal-dependent phosphoesterase TrpH